MAPVDADRNLLFGVLAMQQELLDARQFADACALWALRKDVPLAEVLVEQGWIAPDDRQHLERFLERKLKRHGGNVHATLAAVADAEAREAMKRVDDPDIRNSLSSLPPAAGHVLVETLVRPAEARSRYNLTRLHAEGGLGKVWLAHDTDLNREVALKELKPEQAAHPDAWRRFLREAQVTGQLEHPNIVPVYELARRPEDDQPFYTMRFVRGQTLRQAIAADHERRAQGQADPLQWRKLLQACVGVCQAIGYAHSRGVVHRDLKPDNVVLGGFGEVLVLDWGLAKAVGQSEEDAPALALSEEAGQKQTQPGAWLGTPAYMAPEQAEGRIDLVDARTDIYGLGTILFELLTGRPPHTGSDTRELLAQVAAGPTPRTRELDRTVPPALDAICAKAMARARAERYATAQDLARDLERFLADEPVSAWPEPWPVRAGRWARRHRSLVAAAAGVLVIAVAAAGLVAWERTRHARALNNQRLRAEAGERQAIDAVKRFRDAVASNPELKNNPALAPLRRALLQEPLAFFRTLRDRLLRERGANRESLSRLAEAAFELARLINEIGDKQNALRAYQEALAFRERLARGNAGATQFQRNLAQCHNSIGILQQVTGRPADALASYRKALAILDRLARDNPGVTQFQRELAAIHYNTGILQKEAGRPADALASYRKAVAIQERLARDNPVATQFQADLAKSHNGIGWLERELGQSIDALASLNKALAIQQRLACDNPTVTELQSDLALSHYNMGRVQRDLGRPDDALTSHRNALAIRERLVRGSPASTKFQCDLAQTHQNIGFLQLELGRSADALASYGEALAIQDRLARENPSVTQFQSDLALSHNDIGILQRHLGRPDDARASYNNAVAIRERLVREHPTITYHHSDLGATLNNVAMLDLAEHRPAQARSRLLRAIEAQRRALSVYPNNPTYRQYLANHYRNLITADLALGNQDEATATQRALEELRRSDPRVIALNARLDTVLKGQGPAPNVPELLQLAQRAYEQARHAAAARLFAEALRREPKVAENPAAGQRYNAACAAALAGCGQGQDNPPPDAAARAAWRSQALAWLKADLAAWSRVQASGPAQSAKALVPTLRHWKEDPDLAGLRDEAALATLPESERTACRQLWATVEALLRQASGESPTMELPANPFAR
jgi:serine/threonine-protein kinase